MASIHFRQQHKRKIYWKYTENFLRVRLLLAMFGTLKDAINNFITEYHNLFKPAVIILSAGKIFAIDLSH